MKYQKIQDKAAAVEPDKAGINLLDHDICLPAALLNQDAVLHNINWMQQFADASGVLLAPHGKTTMTPWLFQQQLAAGAWGLTVATAYQAQIAAAAGASRLIIANQLLGAANMAVVSALISAGVEVFVCVDHADNARQLSAFFAARQQRLPVLIELGVPGGRCGCRSHQQVLALARLMTVMPGIALAGIEFYEGVISSNDTEHSVRQFVQQAAALSKQLFQLNLLTYNNLLISGAGSAWYDIVAAELTKAALPAGLQIVLRPGCYVSHDHGIYCQAQQSILKRSELAARLGPGLVNALQLAVYVQSLPEPGMAILNFGKRDAAYDAGLPQAAALWRNGELISDNLSDCQTVKVMDQHAFWQYSATVTPQIGDIVLLNTSHPCLTFDKWRHLWLVDNQYRLLQQIATFF